MLFYGVLGLLATCGYVSAECSGGCNEPTLFYETLGCKPIFASPTDCCPSNFDCSHVTARSAANEEKCYFNGKVYNAGEQITQDEVYGNCKVGCMCRKKNSGKMGFTCAILDCPEWLGRHAKPGCYLKYEVDKCCSVGEACEPFSATCKVDGKTYHEGQKFANPNKKCAQCVCQEGWQGKFEAPFCKNSRCVEEVSQHKEVYGFCAPSYIKKEDCCPFNWICPENGDTITAKSGGTNSDLKCQFGDKTLNLGDKFERTQGEKGKLSCECRIPPYLTCIQNYDYPAYAPEY